MTSVTLFKGCMYSSKTTSMLGKVSTHSLNTKHRCLLVKYSDATRYSTSEIVTHLGLKLPIETVSISSIVAVDWEKYDVIGVDEAQFFTGIGSLVRDFILNRKVGPKYLYLSGLSSTFDLEPWDEITRLEAVIPPPGIVSLTSVCARCGGDAWYSKRLEGCTNEQVDIHATYIPCCAKCWLKY